MAEFCEGCPMRGRVEGEVHYLGAQEIATMHIHRGIFSSSGPYVTNRRRAGVLVDDDYNPSMPIWLGGIETADTLSKKVDDCEGPFVTERKRLFLKLKKEFFCPAIGRLAISRSDEAYRIMAEQVNL